MCTALPIRREFLIYSRESIKIGPSFLLALFIILVIGAKCDAQKKTYLITFRGDAQAARFSPRAQSKKYPENR